MTRNELNKFQIHFCEAKQLNVQTFAQTPNTQHATDQCVCKYWPTKPAQTHARTKQEELQNAKTLYHRRSGRIKNGRINEGIREGIPRIRK